MIFCRPAYFCLEMQAVTKMADWTKLRQTEPVFVDFSNLAKFSKIRQREISLADLTILKNFRHLCFCMLFWTYRSAAIAFVPTSPVHVSCRFVNTNILEYYTWLILFDKLLCSYRLSEISRLSYLRRITSFVGTCPIILSRFITSPIV